MKLVFFGFIKNAFVFLGSGVFSFVVIFSFSKKSILGLLNNKDMGLSAVVLAPVFLIYFVVFGIAGGMLGVIIYNLVKFFKRQKVS